MARISLVPQNKQFFRLLERASDNAVGISRQLVQLLDAFPSNGTNLREIKELEHEGDRLTREVVDLLNRTFVTPFDRDDIYLLAGAIDDVCDHIDEAAGNIVGYGVEQIRPKAKEQAEVILRSRSGEAAVRVPQAAASPGIFMTATDGNIFHGDNTRVWIFSPARPGEELVLFASGLGKVNPPVQTDLPAPSSPVARTELLPRVRVAGQLAEVRFAGLTPGFLGLYQVNFVVPAGLLGPVPLVVESAGVSSNIVLLQVSP